LQHHNNQIKEAGCGEIQPQPIADESYQPYKKNAGDSPNSGAPESLDLDSLHTKYSLGRFQASLTLL
jgi:hypothetical protein